MRILHIIPYMHPSAGGPPVVVDNWCTGLIRRHVESQVLTTDSYAPTDDHSWQADYLSRYPLTVVKCVGPRGFGYSPELRSALTDRLPYVDLIHVHNVWGYANRLVANLCPKRDIPFVVSPHGMLDPHSVRRKAWKKRLYGRLLEFPALRRASAMIFTHREEERLARETCPFLPTGYVVSLGTEDPPHQDREQLSNLFLAKFPELKDTERIIFMSRLHSKKGLDLLLPAFGRIARVRKTARLVLVGPSDSAYLRELSTIAEAIGIKDRVIFTGPLAGQDKWAALASATVYVLPSYQENFAIALVEAMRVGAPVVCSRRVNICSDLVSARAATVCELTVESVMESILALLNDRRRAGEQGSRGATFAARNYTWGQSVESLMSTYESVRRQ